MQLDLIPCGYTSNATTLLNASIAAFDDAYKAPPLCGCCPEIDDKKTTDAFFTKNKVQDDQPKKEGVKPQNSPKKTEPKKN